MSALWNLDDVDTIRGIIRLFEMKSTVQHLKLGVEIVPAKASQSGKSITHSDLQYLKAVTSDPRVAWINVTREPFEPIFFTSLEDSIQNMTEENRHSEDELPNILRLST